MADIARLIMRRDCLLNNRPPTLHTEISSHAASIILGFSMRKLLVSKMVQTQALSTHSSSPWTGALTLESANLATKRGRWFGSVQCASSISYMTRSTAYG